jgi:hypothetical protein
LGQSGSQTPGTAATDEKAEIGARVILIGLRARAIRLVNRRAEPSCR